MARFCSVITRNFLAHARVLDQSLREHHTDIDFSVLVVDETESKGYSENFQVLTPIDLGLDRSRLHEMAAIYDARLLCVALEPALCLHLLRTTNQPIVYLDTDVLVLSPLDAVDLLAREHALVLTPHRLRPVPRLPRQGDPGQSKGSHSFELQLLDDLHLLLDGQFNAGFYAVSQRASPFLQWWDGWLRYHCLDQRESGLVGNQRWLDCVPTFFPHFVLRDPGYNVGWWNLNERPISKRDGVYICAEARLRFFHFSGFDPTRPDTLAHYLRFRVTGAVAELCEEYAARLIDQGYGEAASIPFGFATTADGLPMDARTRRLVREAVSTHEEHVPDPFDAQTSRDFTAWLRSPSASTSGVSRYLADVYATRADVRAHFSALERDADRRGFFRWLRESAVHEERIPEELLPPPENASLGTPDEAALGRAQAHQQQEQVGALHAENAMLREHARTLQRELDALHSSKTFRYSAPMRAVWGALRKIRS